ncbi:alpha/beta-hydrolase, partial [Aureobasidium pullulans]
IWVEQLAGTGFSSKGSTLDATSEEEVAEQFASFWANFLNTFGLHNKKVYITGESYARLYVPYIADNFIQKNNSRLYDVHGIMIYDPLISYETDIYNAVSLVNPCFDIYQVATTCPLLYDVLGFPGSFEYLPEGVQIYFNRTDVQKAINAPNQEWEECTDGILLRDTSEYASLIALPKVIKHTNNVIIGQGMLDYIISYNGTLMAINNMTWNGAQGFSKGPLAFEEFFVPYHSELNLGGLAGSGVQGAWHTERGLTFATVELSSHMVP